MKNYAFKHSYHGFTVPGWFDEHNKEWYNEKVRNIKNGLIVETGVYGGASLLSIADTCKENNNEIHGIDPWDWDMDHLTLMRGLNIILQKLKYNNFVRLIKRNSLNVVSRYADNSVDLVFIDTSHKYKNTLNEMNGWYPKIKKNGILSGHDYESEFHGVIQAVNEFSTNSNLELKISDNIWEITKI